MVVAILLGGLGLVALAYSFVLWLTAAAKGAGRPSLEGIGLGAITNFFDTLGIGSFAPTTAWIKLRRLMPDSYIPATLNSGHALPTMAQSGIFLVLLGVSVDPVLLASCVGAAVLGAAVGAPLVLKAPVRLVQGMIGLALVIAACLYAAANLDLMPVGGSASGLEGPVLWLAIAAHFVLGALMTFGIGLYAPSLILLSLMGLDPRLAFPVMASACAFLMPVGAFRFVRSERIDLRLVLGLALGGIPAVLLAAFVVKELPVEMLRWGVVAVALYAAVLLLLAAIRPGQAEDAET